MISPRLFDEDVDPLLARILTARGYDVLTTQEAHRVSSSDTNQLVFATQEQRVLLTHNIAHVNRLARGWAAQGQEHPGIVVSDQLPLKELLARVLLRASAAKRAWAPLVKQVYDVDPLVCPRCAGSMRIIAFIEQPEVIEKIFRHLALWPATAHSPPAMSGSVSGSGFRYGVIRWGPRVVGVPASPNFGENDLPQNDKGQTRLVFL
jgi:uncharacterized protein with PIN domain